METKLIPVWPELTIWTMTVVTRWSDPLVDSHSWTTVGAPAERSWHTWSASSPPSWSLSTARPGERRAPGCSYSCSHWETSSGWSTAPLQSYGWSSPLSSCSLSWRITQHPHWPHLSEPGQPRHWTERIFHSMKIINHWHQPVHRHQYQNHTNYL